MEPKARPRVWTLIAGSFGLGLAAVGFVIFIGQIIYWLKTQSWESVTIGSALADQTVRYIGPFARDWLDESGAGLHDAVVRLMKFVPLSVFLVVVGGAIALRASNAGRR